LIILDGWGHSEKTTANAIHSARTPVWDSLWNDHPHTLINASGTRVGLPGEQMGNSEVGHMNIGSGRIIRQEYTRISDAIDDGSFFSNYILESACRNTATSGKAIHILGLLSPGGVHSHQQHIYAIMDLASRCDLDNIYLHAFLDGRDTPPKSAKEYLQQTQAWMEKSGAGQIASIIGRYYAMDRNNNWDRIQAAYDLICQGKADYQSLDALTAIDLAYARGESDEFVKATAVTGVDGRPRQVQDGDLIVFANFRADRARQLCMALTWSDFDNFPRGRIPQLSSFISMTEYKDDFEFPVLFKPEVHSNVLGKYLADQGLHQLRIAETEKYAHVTFFFNGGEELAFENEDRVLVASPDVTTYDQKPEMSVFEVTGKMIEAIQSKKYDAIFSNFANADMVGHTGNFEAAVKSIEAVDECLGQIVEATRDTGGELLITADHGNAEQMQACPDGSSTPQPHTAHTSNLVPLLYMGRPADMIPDSGALCDIAPTILTLLGLAQPEEMTGKSLLSVHENATPELSTD